MKKLLILLFSILISFNSYGEVELDFSSDIFCDQSPKVLAIGNLFYHLNQQKPYSGENICVYLLNGQYYSQGEMKNGLMYGKWTYWHENGQKSKEEKYKDGKKDGKQIDWNKNDQKWVEATFINGECTSGDEEESNCDYWKIR